MITETLLRELLRQPEGNTLDFKERHKVFDGTEEHQADFLKDMVAFANTRSGSDAHLVVGVRWKPGEGATVVGQEEHPDQASVQQFLDSKTNRSINFEHDVVTIDGKKVGVYRIDKDQRRPIFLKTDFGRTRARAAYVRRGSSTEIMSPDDIQQLVPVTRQGGPWDGKQGLQIKQMVDRWFRIFQAHDVQPHRIPELLPGFVIPLDMLTDWRDTARLLENRDLRRATCELFNIDDEWLEQDGPRTLRTAVIHERNPASVLRHFAEAFRYGDDGEFLAFNSSADELVPPYRQAGALLLRVEVQMHCETSIYRYTPFFSLDHWAYPSQRRLALYAILAATEMPLNVNGYTLPEKDLELLREGRVFPGEVLRRARKTWHAWHLVSDRETPDSAELSGFQAEAKGNGFLAALEQLAAQYRPKPMHLPNPMDLPNPTDP